MKDIFNAHRLFSALMLALLISPGTMAPAKSEGSGSKAELPVSIDTTLFDFNPNEDMATAHTLIVGRVNQSTGGRARALIKFNLHEVIPSGARIQSVVLGITVAAVNREDPVVLALHRMLRNWNGLSTWNDASHPVGNWAVPGGERGKDFAHAASGITEILGKNEYQFTSTPGLVADVQEWLDNPNGNHGWLLLSRSEQIQRTARRLVSGDHPNGQGPRLIVTYIQSSQSK